MTFFFTSDQHFFHKNILEFEQRPFSTVAEMNEKMIAAWNSVVKQDDTVYFLGDFCLGKIQNWKDVLNQLRGKIILIKGNHDISKIVEKLLGEGYIDELHMVGAHLKVGSYILNLTHYPLEIGNRPRNFSIHGHIHSTPSNMMNQINVGVDGELAKKLNKPFGTPITLDELIAHLDEINPKVKELFLKERDMWEESNGD